MFSATTGKKNSSSSSSGSSSSSRSSSSKGGGGGLVVVVITKSRDGCIINDIGNVRTKSRGGSNSYQDILISRAVALTSLLLLLISLVFMVVTSPLEIEPVKRSPYSPIKIDAPLASPPSENPGKITNLFSKFVVTFVD